MKAKYGRMILLGLLILCFIGGNQAFVSAREEQTEQEEYLQLMGLQTQDVVWVPEEKLDEIQWCKVSPASYRYTFSEEIELFATAPEGTTLTVGLFFDGKDGTRLWYRDQQTAQASGMLQMVVPLPVDGTLKLVLIAEQGEEAKATLYTVERSSEEIYQQLTDLYINLYEAGKK